ncbi:hypothetical protein niasHS_010276 [Heterodera schachtii]|uniref:ubiquitinyl hydrolase 1 n=1 Tax=Heterodera schachtii TaxID=97005 RepID=A0ABD2IZ88_HETSC
MDERERSRAKEFWAGRRTMTKAEFVAEFLTHPDIGRHRCAQILDFVFQRGDTLTGDKFLLAFEALRTDGWPCGVTWDKFANFSVPKYSECNGTLNEVIAGVTHFEVDQIAWLERRFWERCDRRSLSIADSAFVSAVLSVTKRSEVANRVFRLFTEHCNSAIGFKEYVCGLSSLCQGPEAERMKFVVGIWDSDMDGILSRKDLNEIADFFGFPMDLLVPHVEEGQTRDAAPLHIFDFVCLASKSATVREALLQFSNKLWVALTTSPSSSPTISTPSTTCNDAATSVDDDQSEGDKADDEEGSERQMDGRDDEQRRQQNGQEQLQRPGGRRRLGGVRNIGNTCYLGAAIQTLANVSLLSGFLLSNEQQFRHLPLVRHYVQMLRSLLVAKETASPVELKESVSVLCSHFADHLQHDSQEFIQFFLDALHEQLKTVPSPSASSSPSSPPAAFRFGEKMVEEDGENGQPPQRKAKQKTCTTEGAKIGVDEMDGTDEGNTVWQNANSQWEKEVLSSRHGSIVLDLFAGQFLSSLRCPSCAHSSNKFELFTMLQLQIPVSETILIPFQVVLKDPTVPIVRYELRLPTTTKIERVKRLICERIGIDISDLLVVILNKSSGKYNATLSQMFNGTDCADGEAEDDHGSTLMGTPFISDIDIWCYETEPMEEDDESGKVDNEEEQEDWSGGGGHVICVHRQIHFKNSFAALALNGIGTYTFGTPIVLTFPTNNNNEKTQKTDTVRPCQLYAMVLEYVQKRYLRNSQRHLLKNNSGGGKGDRPQHHLFNRALDANADSVHQNSYPFELALTKSDAIWCYKCHWQRFCRGCPIDANSSDCLLLDELFSWQCLLTITWKNNAALYLLYNNLAERFSDDSQRSLSSNANSDLLSLDNVPPGVTVDDCLSDFTRTERIDGSHCDQCSSKGQSTMPPLTKQLSFVRLPDILVICFKRFTFVPSLQQFVKQIVPISFPLDNFDPSKYLSSDVPAEQMANFSRYFCIGIVTHYGQMNFGHYCSYVRDFFSDEWFFCNDNKTFPVKSSEVDTRNAYIVFYQRVTSAAAADHRTNQQNPSPPGKRE